jgi:protein-S-isoprenylcysteine O-methyltransferase Ste14
MAYIFLGVLGFVIFHLVDLAAIWRLPAAKPAFWFSGCLLVAYSAVKACLAPTRIFLPGWVSGLGWMLVLVSILQIFYSLFLNLPFKKTYLKTGVGDELITTGLYGIIRHPGVWGLGVLMAALVMISRSRLMLLAAPVWLVTDIIVVTIQDYLFFTRMFPGYREYRVNTPMLLPRWRSITRLFCRLRYSIQTRGGTQI